MTRSRRLPLIAFAAAVLPLGACSSAVEAVRGPQISAMAYPAALMPMQQQVLPAPGTSAGRASPGSLWKTNSSNFFRGNRAEKMGDILTVQIDINDNAKLSNQSATSRTTSVDGGVSAFFGLESSIPNVLPNTVDPAHLVTAGSTTSADGQGSVTRSEAVSLTVAAVVTAVLPNGNLVIQGRQEVRINQELRELTVSGIVRQQDISAYNTIRHTQIAEARVSYGGRGSVSRVQKVPAGQALIEQFTPF